ncbi:putative oxidoreductase DltE [Fusarium oxysporum f. sp. albedinis]|nr:putative oxidoreductase DltE [Fusarium oxysporum f. sp. albedinis]
MKLGITWSFPFHIMNRHQCPLHEPPQESPDGSSPMSLFPQMPLRDLDSEIENIEKFFLLGLSQPAQERDGLKELEANFKESAKTGDLQALQTLTNPHLQPPDIKRTQPGPHDFHSSPYPQMPTDKIVDYTESYRLRYNSARNFIKRIKLVCRRLQKFLTKEPSVTGCEKHRLRTTQGLFRHPKVVLGNGLHYLRLTGTNYQPLDLISAFSALIVASSLIHQAPGQVKELEQKFNEDLGRWKTLSAQNQPDPFGLFQEVVGAAFALKSFPRAAPLYVSGNEGLPPRVANMHPSNPNVFAQLQSTKNDIAIQEIYDQGPDLDAFENTIDNLFGASEDHQAPDQHDSGISMGTSVEDSMYYQMPDEGADDPWAPVMQ